MEYYLALKRNEALAHGTTWMNLENIPDNKRPYAVWSYLHQRSSIGKSREREKVAVGGWRWGEWGEAAHGTVLFGVMSLLGNWMEVIVVHHCECNQCHWVMHTLKCLILCYANFTTTTKKILVNAVLGWALFISWKRGQHGQQPPGGPHGFPHPREARSPFSPQRPFPGSPGRKGFFTM